MKDIENINTVEEVNKWEKHWLREEAKEFKRQEAFCRDVSRRNGSHRAPDHQAYQRRIDDIKRDAKYRREDILEGVVNSH